jgi:hypothetical protein
MAMSALKGSPFLRSGGIIQKSKLSSATQRLSIRLLSAPGTCAKPDGPGVRDRSPIEGSPLTKQHRGDRRLIERFEPFAGGMKIGIAWSELNDPVRMIAGRPDTIVGFGEARLYAETAPWRSADHRRRELRRPGRAGTA